MAHPEDRLTTNEAAAIAGVAADSWRSYVSRGQAPRPDGHFGRTPYWLRGTVDGWAAHRLGQGHRSDLDQPGENTGKNTGAAS